MQVITLGRPHRAAARGGGRSLVLARGEASYVTGEALTVDGAHTII